jgi:hypothetical protein
MGAVQRLVRERERRAASRREIYAPAFPYVRAILSNRASDRALPFAASISLFRGEAVVTREPRRCSIECVTSSIARLNASSLAFYGLLIPLTLRTN